MNFDHISNVIASSRRLVSASSLADVVSARQVLATALQALDGNGKRGPGRPAGSKNKQPQAKAKPQVKPTRKFSAATRKKMSEAAKARHARNAAAKGTTKV